MLIVSKFHDYYDIACSLGIDKECVYKRETEIKKSKFHLDPGYRASWLHSEEFIYTKKGVKYKYIISKIVIGFCGKLYPAIIVKKYVWITSYELKDKTILYSKDKVFSYIEKEKIRIDNNQYSVWNIDDFSIRTSEGMNNFFGGTLFKKLEDEFIKHKCPVFIYGRFEDEKQKYNSKVQLLLNPCLKDYKFFQVKDPVTAYQELYIYISGVLGSIGPKTIKISDKELAKKKGYDDKYSFRKPPGKRGNPQWR